MLVSRHGEDDGQSLINRLQYILPCKANIEDQTKFYIGIRELSSGKRWAASLLSFQKAIIPHFGQGDKVSTITYGTRYTVILPDVLSLLFRQQG